jgi:phosphate transport system protein
MFDRELKTLNGDLLRLGELVETQLVEAVLALQNRDTAMARRVVEFDATINQMRYDIEEHCYTLLALQQPNATDLRRIVAGVSIATNLERMGDHAAGIGRLTLRLAELPAAIHIPMFTEMAKLAADNLAQTMVALDGFNADLARQVVAQDAKIDEVHKRIYDYLIKTMTDNPATIEYATLLLWVSHDIERFADRVCNICERIVYTVTGNLHEPRTK